MSNFSYTVTTDPQGGFGYIVHKDGVAIHNQPFNFRAPGGLPYANELEASECALQLIADYETPAVPAE